MPTTWVFKNEQLADTWLSEPWEQDIRGYFQGDHDTHMARAENRMSASHRAIIMEDFVTPQIQRQDS